MKAYSILVVEDSDTLRKIIAARLKKLGATVHEASDGTEALTKVNDVEIDLILTDLDMPNLDGIALCRRLKEDEQKRVIPIVLLAPADGEKDVERGFAAGASAYISPKASDAAIIETLETLLEETQMKRSSTVMVVDDTLSILKLVEAGLGKAGFNVVTAENGEAALGKLRSITPDIIISDLDMPKMSGQEFADHLKADPELCKIPLVIMSANSERATMLKMIEKGVASYLVKPFNLDQFVITVEKLLSEQFQIILREKERLESERNSMLGAITSLVQALEARDSYTSGHSLRVSLIAKGIGKKLGLDSDSLEDLEIAAKMHDVGKIGIPDGMLLKKGRLSKEEVDLFQRHPAIGAEILSPIRSLAKILPTVLHHHEHYNGGGYPAGLVGQEIPIGARICAVADCYDALTTNRPYRKGFPKPKALSIIQEIRGTQLCPECVDAFKEWAAEI